jgi:hypothetical protein
VVNDGIVFDAKFNQQRKPRGKARRRIASFWKANNPFHNGDTEARRKTVGYFSIPPAYARTPPAVFQVIRKSYPDVKIRTHLSFVGELFAFEGCQTSILSALFSLAENHKN